MPNVSSLIAPKRILADIGGMVANPLKGAPDEDEIQITGYVFRVCGGPGNKPFADIGRQSVQFLIASFQRLRERAISLSKSPNAIAKNR
jgi:hypothetical protein